MTNPFRRRKKKRREGMSFFKAGVIGIVLIAVFSYMAATKFANPLASQYTVQATFASAAGLRPESLVRIAGVNVGKVTQVQPVAGCKQAGTGSASQTGCQASVVSMTIMPMGLPLHEDATFNIRPRIFLEGNFFLDIHPGTPSAKIAPNGYTFPVSQGTEPVQFDQLLDALPSDTRHNLQILVDQAGSGLKQGGPSYNQSIQYWLPAYKYTSIVGHDALGIQPHDLSNFISQAGTVAAAVDAHPQHLQSLVTDFNTTAAAFARQNVNLQSAVNELPRTLGAAIPAFNSLNAAFPPLRQLARALLPGVRSTGPTVDASLPFIHQLRGLVQPSELRGLTADLAVAIPSLARLTRETIPLMRNQVRPASSCVVGQIHPWSESSINDPNFNASNGFPIRKNFQEAGDFLPGLAGESRVFDANGPVIRIAFTGGTFTYSLSPHVFGQAVAPLGGAQPAPPAGFKNPPLEPNVPCETQAPITNMDAAQVGLQPVAGSNGSVLGNVLQSGLGGLGLSRDRSKTAKGATTSTTTTGSGTTTTGTGTTTTGTTTTTPSLTTTSPAATTAPSGSAKGKTG